MRLTRRDFNRIIDRIEFTDYQPHEVPKERARRLVSAKNVRFGEKDSEVRAVLAPLEGVQGMSTFANAYIIHEITQHLESDEAYLNVGVWQGFTFLAGVLNRNCISIGIDNFSLFGGPRDRFQENFNRLKHSRSSFWDMDYAEYLKTKHDGTRLGLYFYDGAHDYINQLMALEIAEPFFAKNAIILVDDTNHAPARKATLDFTISRQGRYEILFDQFTAVNGHPTYHNGLMILRAV